MKKKIFFFIIQERVIKEIVEDIQKDSRNEISTD